MQRDFTNKQEIEHVVTLLREGLDARIAKHGLSKFASRAEAIGTILEEFDELKEAAHANDHTEFIDEAMDVVVAAFWAIVSLQTKPNACDSCGKLEKSGRGLRVSAVPGDKKDNYFYCDDCVLPNVPVLDLDKLGTE